MILETKRLRIHTATQEKMTTLMKKQTDDVLKTAYREMLQGCTDHSEQWMWFAIWSIESREGIHIGDLSFSDTVQQSYALWQLLPLFRKGITSERKSAKQKND